MAIIPIPLVGGHYKHSYLHVDAQDTINWYAEKNPSGAQTNQYALLPFEGYTAFCSIGYGQVRGMFQASNGGLYAACETNIYKINGLGNTVLIAQLTTNSGKVEFAENGFDIVVVDGLAAVKISIIADTAEALVLPNNMRPTDVVCLNGRFVFNELNTGRFWWSDLYTTTVNGLSFATAESNPDNLIKLAEHNRELWLFGEKTTEVWAVSEDQDAPFARIGGAIIQAGIQARNTVQKIGDHICWLGRNKEGGFSVLAVTGYQSSVISTPAIDAEINNMAIVEDAIAWTYNKNGHLFYVLSFPDADKTFCYDFLTNLWCVLAWADDDNILRMHRAAHSVFFNDSHYIGDYYSGNIYKLGGDTFNGKTIIRQRTMEHYRSIGENIKLNKVEFIAHTPVEYIGQNRLMFQYSKDYGATWSNWLISDITNTGEHSKRVIFRSLGLSRQWTLRLRSTDSAPVALISAIIDAEGAKW